MEGLGELEDAADEIKGATKELNELLDRVKSAREDPESMDGESYGQLITDITKFGASRVPLTGPMNLATGAASHAIVSLLGLETAFALSIIRKRFIDLGGTPDMSEEDAEELAGEVSWSSADSDAIFLWWRRGMPVIPNRSFRETLMLPLEDFWIKIRLGIFGGLGVSSMPGRMGCLPKGCLPLLLVALLVVLTLAGWLLLRNGGDATRRW